MTHFNDTLERSDPDVFQAIQDEEHRQRSQIELIASENFVSRAVLEAQGSVFTNKTVEGYPWERYYGGAEFADRIEDLARERAKELFGCRFANVQPHTGSNANQAVYLALMNPGDTILSMNLTAGGHISHGHPATLTGRHYRIVSYGVDSETECIDYDEVEALAKQYKPRLIIVGGSSYPRQLDFARFKQAADRVNAYVLADIAHIAGLVVSGHHPHPFPHVDIVTTTTYKSLRGARGAIILTNDEALDNKIAKGVFPGVQGSVLLHGVAGKAVCLAEALVPEFKTYCGEVVANARTLARSLSAHGIGLVTGGTDTGMLLVDLVRSGSENYAAARTGAAVVDSLERAGIAANKNVIPGDRRPPEIASGIRLSTNAGTTRGFGAKEFELIGEWIARITRTVETEQSETIAAVESEVRNGVSALSQRFPFYG